MTPGVQDRLQRRRLGVGPAGRPLGLRHERERAVEPRRRIDHRPVVELLAVVLQLRLVRADPGDDRRRRRLGAVERPVDQPGDQERQQRVQGHRASRTFENDAMQGENVTEELFNSGASGFLSGNPLQKIGDYSVESGGPIMKNRLWCWGGGRQAGHQRRHHQLLRRHARARSVSDLVTAQQQATPWARRSPTTSWRTSASACSNDKTIIKDLQRQGQLPAESRRTSSSTCSRATTSSATRRGASATTRRKRPPQQISRQAVAPAAADALADAHADRHRQAGVQQPVHLRARRLLPRLPGRPTQLRRQRAIPGATNYDDYSTGDAPVPDCLWNSSRCSNRTTGVQQPLARRRRIRPSGTTWEAKIGRHLLPDQHARRRPQPEVRRSAGARTRS